MSDNFLGPKPVRTAAAFLWMPQLRLSFRQMSYLGPVFVHVLASAFVSAGLLPRNHPALMYGVEGVRKYGVADIIGEAWFTLRSTRAGVNQWGVFAGVMLMIAMVIGALLSFLLTVSFGVGATAQAQLFSHPAGDSSFGNNGYSNNPTADPFDRLIPPANTVAGDYGIMMLDKAIRAGANGQGGALQRATQELMLVYNSGVMVIASVIIFWMIVSIVVDTAKTGQVGGGRHNMVWLPIRIVFALALLIPLGSNGYSSGQYMVMKVAEWGSNFGTRAWTAYVQGVSDNLALISSGEADYAGEAVVSYTKMWLCRIAVNANLSNGNSGDLDEYVVEKTTTRFENDRSAGTPTGNTQISRGEALDRTVYFERNGSRGMCGSITFPLRTQADARRPLDRAIQQLQIDMALAFYNQLRNVEPQVINFACDYAAGQKELSGALMANAESRLGEQGYAKVVGGTTLRGWETCAGSAADEGRRPAVGANKDALQSIINDYQNRVRGDYSAALNRFQESQELLVTEMTERGWAGMGVFYQRIAHMNAAVFQAQRPSSIITVGNFEEMEAEKSSWLSSLFGNDDQWIIDSQGTLTDFQNWWTSVPENGEVTAQTQGTDSRSLSMADAKRDPAGALVGQMGFGETNGLVRLLSDDGDLSKSPLAVISSVGDYLFWVPFAGAISLTIAQVVLGATTGYVSGGAVTIALASLVDMLMSMMMLPMLAGLMLKFYLPLIPFIRVLLSVLTWIISVFEAVVMVPIAALAHLSSQGEGLAVGAAESAWKLWLNILLRPILTVMGFVGAMLVFNAFASYVNGAFADMWENLDGGGLDFVIQWVILAVLYCFIMYTVANTVFKMLDLIPDALTRWYGLPGRDQSFDGINEGAFLASNVIGKMGAPKASGMIKKKEPKEDDPKKNPGVEEDGKEK